MTDPTSAQPLRSRPLSQAFHLLRLPQSQPSSSHDYRNASRVGAAVRYDLKNEGSEVLRVVLPSVEFTLRMARLVRVAVVNSSPSLPPFSKALRTGFHPTSLSATDLPSQRRYVLLLPQEISSRRSPSVPALGR